MSRLLTVVAVVMALAVGACTGGDEPVAGPATDPGPAATTVPAAPDVPGGPVPAELAAVLDDPTSITIAEIDALAATGDVRAAWPLTDLMRLHADTPTEAFLSQAAEALTGVDLVTAASLQRPLVGAAEPEPVRWAAYSDLLLRWDVPAPPGYVATKRDLFALIDPAFADFLPDDTALDPRQVTWGGVRFGDIAALDDPVTVPVGDAWDDDEPVVTLEVGGETRAYPRRILEVHELVNDTVGGRRVALTFCTLCGSAVAYDLDATPAVAGLETTGLLRRSNKLVVDPATGSVFDQFEGTALSGPLADDGVDLETIATSVTELGPWREEHPQGTVVAPDPGTGRTYRADPLDGRDDLGPIFPVGERDDRLAENVVVAGVITADGDAVAFPVEAARTALAAGDTVESGGVRLRLEAGALAATGPDGEGLAVQESFWFAWSQFHPGTALWPTGN